MPKVMSLFLFFFFVIWTEETTTRQTNWAVNWIKDWKALVQRVYTLARRYSLVTHVNSLCYGYLSSQYSVLKESRVSFFFFLSRV